MSPKNPSAKDIVPGKYWKVLEPPGGGTRWKGVRSLGDALQEFRRINNVHAKHILWGVHKFSWGVNILALLLMSWQHVFILNCSSRTFRDYTIV